ncbi:LytR/AlgR family response regulator transcription factor [Faecalicatena contorta]|uniref:Stage 0 sporulation protein A homolog n=1 Tax=Faecalicatena contorta TaxID=39482 RepID=A0A316AHM0_9FIRM|nr:LytTR family DNA-binding domain-containing protein [Faecalicatena contorta]PWJ49397.1 LytTR family two component transcriptional regulator [Faecalicatena contorta]SUQ14641.1 DNA-binding response regulator, LytR/AlgR family [Faecalicatena contorta]
MYKIAICDDENEFRETVMKKIQDLNMVAGSICFSQFETGEELVKSDMDFDLLFLDIQMPGLDGNKTSKIFREHNKKCILVFCTNYQTPKAENFKVYPYRYIMKDIKNKGLFEELPDILEEMMERGRKHYIVVTQDGVITRVLLENVLYFTVDGRQTKIVYNKSGVFQYIYCREKLKELYPKLCQGGFEYAHSSFIVNMSNISRIEGKVIIMENEERLYISRSKAKIFDDAFTRYLNRKFRRR